MRVECVCVCESFSGFRVSYCTVKHFHYHQLVSIHAVDQNVGPLYTSTCIQDILYVPIDVCSHFIVLLIVFLVLMHCSQPCHSPPPHFKFLFSLL